MLVSVHLDVQQEGKVQPPSNGWITILKAKRLKWEGFLRGNNGRHWWGHVLVLTVPACCLPGFAAFMWIVRHTPHFFSCFSFSFLGLLDSTTLSSACFVLTSSHPPLELFLTVFWGLDATFHGSNGFYLQISSPKTLTSITVCGVY